MQLKFTPHLANRKYGYFSYLAEIIALFAVYFSTAKLGLSMDAVSRFATLIWSPSGIAAAALLLFGYRLWPGIIIGAFLVNLLNGAPLFVAVGIGVGNTLEAVVCTFLLKRNGFSYSLDHLRDVLLLVLLAMPLSAFIGTTIGESSLFLGKVITSSSYFLTWEAWWTGDMISILILTPFLLTWSKWPRDKASVKRIAEIGILTLVILAVGLIVFLGFFHADDRSYPITYLVFPPLIWASLRFGQHGATSAMFAFTILAVVGTIRALTPFLPGILSENLLLLQSFMGVIAITSMILAAVTAERRELERRKDEFISMVSHELKTPLTTVQGYTELLHERFAQQGSQEALRYISKMVTQIDKLSKLIADLLDISKIQVGRLAFAKETVDVDLLVREVVEDLQHTTSQHQISIEGGIEQREIVGDRERLGQVLVNLITNAMKFSPCAEKIVVRLMHTHDTLTVSVQDFGIGISKAHQQKVFERFYRVYNDHDRTYPGLGIGLYIAHGIIEHHKGKMWVESVVGQGSTFSFSLPLAGEA